MYNYRKLTADQQREVVEYRKQQLRPWHSLPHWNFEGERQFIISATCYEHAAIIGTTHERMTECESKILELCEQHTSSLYAWCILPNHYHLLVRTAEIRVLRREIGKFHGTSSFRWNGEDQRRGRTVWCNCFDKPIKSHGHFWASMNYIHHNPVKHGYVERWQDWPWSSAHQFLEQAGRETAEKLWREFPILDYGKKWDIDPEEEEDKDEDPTP